MENNEFIARYNAEVIGQERGINSLLPHFDMLNVVSLPVAIGAVYFGLLVPMLLYAAFFNPGPKAKRAISVYLTPLKLAAALIAVPVRIAYRYCVPGILLRIADKLVTAERIQFLLDRVFRARAIGEDLDILLAGGEQNREAYARKMCPPDRFPTLYIKGIPADIRRPIICDGRLIGGFDVSWLGWRHLTNEIVADIARDAVRVGLRCGVVFGMVTLALSSMMSKTVVPFPYPAWSADILVITKWYLAVGLNAVMSVGGTVGLAIVAGVSFGLAMTYSAFFHRFNRWLQRTTANLRTVTRDATVQYKSNAAMRGIKLGSYHRQVRNCLGRLSDQPVIPIARATGFVAKKGRWDAPQPGQLMCIDGEALRLHLLVLGSTGSMKTFLVLQQAGLRALIEFINAGKSIGGFVTDGKGVLPRDFKALVTAQIKAKKLPTLHITTLGTEAGECGLNLVAGMDHVQIRSAWQDCYTQLSGGQAGGGNSTFFLENGGLLVLSSAMLARVLDQDDDTLCADEWQAYQPLSLIGIHRFANATEEQTKLYVERVEQMMLAVDENTPESLRTILESGDLDAALRFWKDTWSKMATETKSGIVGNVNVVLGGLASAGRLRDQFATGKQTSNADVTDAFKDRSLVFENISEDWGNEGRVVKIFLKKRFENAARKRMATNPAACKSHSVLFIADEYHLTAGNKDPEFWSIARASGCMGMMATQSMAPLQIVFGESGTASFMSNVQNIVALKLTEVDTLKYFAEACGSVLRGQIVDGDMYETQPEREAEKADRLVPYRRSDALDFTQLGIPDAGDISGMKQAAEVDLRFLPSSSGGGGIGQPGAGQQRADMRLSYEMQATWRAEDKHEARMGQGVSPTPLFEVSDFQTGNGFAFVKVVRGNEARFDLCDMDIDGLL